MTSTSPAAAARPGPTAAQINAQQQQDASRTKQPPRQEVAPAKSLPRDAAVPAQQGAQTAMDAVLNEVAPVSFIGRPAKFDGKDGAHKTKDDGQEMAEGPYIFHYPQTASLWIHFNGPGNSADRVGGYLYDPAFQDTPRESLGDNDPTSWPVGLSGAPEDTWVRQMYLVLEHAITHELFTWIASNKTSLRAAGNLIRHCNRMLEPDGTHLPLILLKAGGYDHPTLHIWVHTPTLQVTGRVPRDGAASTEKLAAAEKQTTELNDEIPY